MTSDVEPQGHRYSIARFFVEDRQVSWVLLVGVIGWGIWAYGAMPKRKDPDIPVRQVAVVTPWPGQSAERVEQLVTRKIEEKLAQNIHLFEIKSSSRAGLSVIYAEVDEGVTDTAREFDDFKVKLDSLTDLPEGAGPIQYIKEFGENAALMLTLASPPAEGAQLKLLASEIEKKIAPVSVAIALCGSGPLHHSFLNEAAELLSARLRDYGARGGLERVEGNGFVLIRGAFPIDRLTLTVDRIWDELLQRADIHPDVWDPIVIGIGPSVRDALQAKAGAKYSYRELDDFTE